jgi:hypothetical protein
MATNDLITELDGFDFIQRPLQTKITDAVLSQLNDQVLVAVLCSA